jgi:hypothetical protein
LTRNHEEKLKSIPLLEPPLLFAALHLGEGFFLALGQTYAALENSLPSHLALENLFQPSLFEKKNLFSSLLHP